MMSSHPPSTACLAAPGSALVLPGAVKDFHRAPGPGSFNISWPLIPKPRQGGPRDLGQNFQRLLVKTLKTIQGSCVVPCLPAHLSLPLEAHEVSGAKQGEQSSAKSCHSSPKLSEGIIHSLLQLFLGFLNHLHLSE